MGVSVRKKDKKSGEWWIFIHHGNQRKSKKIGTNKAEALRLAKIIEGQLAAGSLGVLEGHKEKKTVAQYAEIWLSTVVPATLKASTADDYRGIVKKHIKKSFLANKPVDYVTQWDVETFLLKKREKYAHSTVVHIKNVLGGIFRVAHKDKAIIGNPAHGISLGKKSDESRKPKIEPLTIEETNQLLYTFAEHKSQHYPITLLLVSTGMRIGEACALQWRDIEFDDRSIIVRRNYVRQRVEESTKNSQDRKVDMSIDLLNCLKKLKNKRLKAAIKNGHNDISKDWLFPAVSDESIPLNYQTWRRDVFQPMLTKAELRKIRIHDLRHTFASIMIEKGVDLVYIKDQLGHSSIKVTVDVYGSMVKRSDKPVDILDGLLHSSAPYAHPETKKDSAKKG